MTVGIRQLRYFVAVAEAGNFTRAAAGLRVAQPALSLQIRGLEQDTGVQLFDRHARGVTLTAAGQELLEEASSTLRSYDAFLERAHMLAQGAVSRLRVGFMAHAAAELTSSILRAFKSLHPDVSVEMRQSGFDDCLVGLGIELVDVAFVIGPLDPHDKIAMESLFDDPVVAIMAADHPLASRTSLPIREVVKEPFYCDTHPPGRWRDFWLGMQHRDGGEVRVAGEFALMEEFLQAVATGGGVSLCPATTARYYGRPGLAFVPVEGMEPSPHGVAWRIDRWSPLIGDFVDISLKIADEAAGRSASPGPPAPVRPARSRPSLIGT